MLQQNILLNNNKTILVFLDFIYFLFVKKPSLEMYIWMLILTIDIAFFKLLLLINC